MQILGPKRLNRALGRNLLDKGGATDLFSSASLDLRFALQKTLDPRVTFTRASTGTFVGSDGLLQSATTNEARFDHNPTTGESLGLLVEEARTNLSLYSEDFSNAYWTKTDCTITANDSTAPDGTTTADLWTNIPSAGGAINNSITKDATTRTYTVTMWVKGTVSLFTFTLDFGGTTNRGRAQFNLATNAVVGTTNTGNFTGTSASITAYPGGWARLTMTTTTSTGTTIRFRPFFGTGGESVYIWGAQVEEGAFATSYIPTTTATATRAADVASITGSNFGVTRTNLLLQSEDLLTTWTANDGLARTANQTVSPNGSTTADLLASGGTLIGYLEQPNASSNQFVSGTTYTYSIYLKKANTSTCLTLLFGTTFNSGGGNPVATWNLDTGVPTFVNGATGSMTAVGNGWYRCVVTDTATQTHTQNQQWLRMASASGDVYAWGAQLETGSTATAYIPTTTAAVSVFESSWYNQTEGTVFADNTNYAVSNARIVSFSDNSTSNRFIVGRGTGSSGNINFFVAVGGVTQVSSLILASSLSFGLAAKVAVAVKASDFAGSANGLAPVTQTTGSMTTTLSQLTIGNGETLGLNMFSGTIKRLTYWPVRLATPTLVSITQP